MPNIIGTGPNQVPTNGDLGSLAFQNSESVSLGKVSADELVKNPIISSGVANGVAYLNASKSLTTGSALTFDGTFTSPKYVATSAGNDRLLVEPQAAGSGTLLIGTNNAGSAYAPLVLDGGGIRFNSSGSERMRIDSAGNVGIGTSAPAYKLEVNGTAYVSSTLTVNGDLIVNGTTTTVNSTTLTVDDKNIELGSVSTPTNVTADGGGITLKGATDKTFNWVNSTSAWTSSEHIALAAGKDIILNGTTSGSVTLLVPDVAGSNTVTIPATTGTVVTTGDTGTVTSTMIADGTIVNADINASAAIAISKLATSSSSQLASIISDETGSGSLVFNTSPSLVTPAIGVATGTSLTLTGTLYAASKSFLIPHPTKEGKKLCYGSLEGPENSVYVRGRLKNSSVIDLPEYWTKLVDPDSITVNLTCIGKYQKLYVMEIKDNKVYVGNENVWNTDFECFYTVYAERVDIAKLIVEQD